MSEEREARARAWAEELAAKMYPAPTTIKAGPVLLDLIAAEVLPLLEAKEEAEWFNQRVICSYCGEVRQQAATQEATNEEMVAHIVACSAHPFAKAWADIQRAEAERDSWRELAGSLASRVEAQERFLIAYRTGGDPGEAAFKAMEKTRDALDLYARHVKEKGGAG